MNGVESHMNNISTTSTAPSEPNFFQTGRAFSLVDFIDNILFYRSIFLVITLLFAAISLIYAITSTPIYIADALIQVEEKKGTSLGALSQVANALGAQQSPVLGEIEILRSRAVIGRAVNNLKANIEIRVENRIPIVGNLLTRMLATDSNGLTVPLWESKRFAWGGETLAFEELTVDRSLFGVPLFLKVGPEETWELVDNKDQLLLAGRQLNKLESNSALGVRAEISHLRARPNTTFRVVVYSLQSRISQVLDKFSAGETRRQSNILKLTYENTNPKFSAVMLNEIADTYIQQNVSRRSEEAELSLRFLNEELPKLRIQLDASEKALNDFRSKSKTMDIAAYRARFY